jgi:uncharacterized protein (TIGR02145 family)
MKQNKFLPKLFLLAAVAAAFAACTTPDEPADITTTTDTTTEETLLVPVPFTVCCEPLQFFGDTPPAAADTRAINWDDVTSLDVLVFAGETRVYRKYFDRTALSAGMTLDVPEGTGLVAYAFANVASNVFAGITTLTDLNNATCTIAAWNTMDSWSTVPMSGRSDPFSVSLGQSTTAPKITFTLRRIVAKLTVTLSVSGVTYQTMKIVNLPKQTYYVSRPLDTERQLADDNTARTDKDAVVAGTPAHWIADSGTMTSTSVTFYLFENRPGVSSNTSQTAKGAKSNDTRCTHLVITGEDSNNTYEWTIYLGADATSNYNIKRNCVYTFTATLKKGGATDVRVKTVAKSWSLPDDKATRGTFAGSNIYWDGSKLTFDGAGSTSKQYYQGVYFKWGSLVGISPAAQGSGTDNRNWSGAETIYRTTAYNGSATGGGTKPTWNSAVAASTVYSAYADIPYEVDAFTTYDASQDHLNYTSTKTSKWSTYKGDICRYLGEIGAAPSGYRMPRDEEFVNGGFTIGGTFGNDYALGTADGKKDFSAKGWAKNSAGLYFPAAGYRVTSGKLYNVGNYGSYWSSSAQSAASGFNLYFNSGGAYPSSNLDRQYAFPVRCVKD